MAKLYLVPPAKPANPVRDKPLSDFISAAREIVDSDSVLSIFAACEWEELGDDGHDWVAAIIRETLAREWEAKACHG